MEIGVRTRQQCSASAKRQRVSAGLIARLRATAQRSHSSSMKRIILTCVALVDGKSLVVISTPGSPAAPFYFSFSPENGGYHLRGEGTGSKKVTDAALEDLKRLSDDNVRAL